ncbi:hypothetical protein SAMN05443252_105178 [Bacillus sp. OV322]|uniref:hypothetical protein n=1 Tax=Bacillus sp. OV322 TaxID=1882764 RepID=UPI0008F1C06D|nr:hypothetical protein [Bacillus sp. OV322]SFC66997.1 hypothetical protein SAMN05443252_105178 [Bacillus sp. OV322]
MAKINKTIILFFIIGIFLIGCSNLSGAEPTPDHPLFSADKNKYALLIVDVSEKDADYYRELLDKNKIYNVKKINGRTALEGTNEEYKFLELEKAPAFVIFDTNEVIFTTYSEEELIEFLKENNPN